MAPLDAVEVAETPPLDDAGPAPQVQSVPGPAMVDPVTLLITKLWDAGIPGWRLNLVWSGSAGPFSLVTSPYPRFQTSVTTLADSTTDTSLSRAANTGRTLECFEVSDGTTVSVSEQNLGYEPRPAPTAPIYTDQGYWWGDEITVSASYLDMLGPNNLAHFYDRPAKGYSPVASPSLSGYASQVTFRIPADTLSTWLTVEAGGKLSPNPYWLQMVPKGVSFGSISGIVWAPLNGKVYVSDSVNNTISEVDAFKVTPTKSPLALGMAVTNPLISRVNDAGEFVYISGAAGAPEVRVWTAGGGDAPYANTTDAGFTSSITPRGIALHPNGSACFIADATSRQIIRIPRGNATAINGRWGNVTFGSFPNPCGIDVEPSGAVDVGSGYNTYRINSSGTGYTSNGSTGSTLPKFIEVERDMSYTAGTGVLTYSAEPLAEAFNRNGIEAVAGSDGSGGTPRYKGAIVWSTTDTQRLLLDPIWRYYIGGYWPQRVVLSNSGKPTSEAAYPSSNQTQDRIIKMTANCWPSRSVKLRLIDPADTAPYAPQAGWCGTAGFPPTGGPCTTPSPPYEGNDDIKNFGEVYGLTLDPNGASPTQDLTLAFGSTQWTRDFYLKVPAQYSGNNFRVEVTKINPNTSLPIIEKVAAHSAAYTTWKRVFVEKDRMFRSGGVLAGDVTQGASTIYLAKVYDTTNSKWLRADNVQVNDRIAIFDTQSPFEGAHDEACVIGMANESNDQVPRVTILLGTADCQGGYSLARGYIASVDAAGTWNFGAGRSAGVGGIASSSGVPYDTGLNQINGTNSAFYDADMRDSEQPYSDAFTEIIGSSSGVGAVPYISSAVDPFYVNAAGEGGIEPGTTMRNKFQRLWFTNKDTANYIHSLGVRGDDPVLGEGIGGFSWVGNLYVFTHIETLGQLQTDPVLRANLWRMTHDHECGHLFKTNECVTGPGATHDTRNAWCSSDPGDCSAEPCLMQAVVGNAPNAVNRFCPEDLLRGDPSCSYASGSVRGRDDLVSTP